jgi:hypothetical protein
MADKVVKEENVIINDSKGVRESLDNVEVKFKCKVRGSESGQKAGGLGEGVEVTDVKIKLIFTGTTVFEALKFAAGGQSFRVAIQARLRKTPKAKLEKETQTFAMSDIFHPVRTGFTRTPEQMLSSLLTKVSKEELLKMLAEAEAKARETI